MSDNNYEQIADHIWSMLNIKRNKKLTNDQQKEIIRKSIANLASLSLSAISLIKSYATLSDESILTVLWSLMCFSYSYGFG